MQKNRLMSQRHREAATILPILSGSPSLQLGSDDIDKLRHREELASFHAEALANRAKDRVEKQLEVTTAEINIEYRRRIKETRDMIAQLTKSSGELAEERKALKEAHEQLIGYLAKLQNPLSLNLQWVQLRKSMGRGGQNTSSSSVSDAMDNNHRDLRSAVVKVTASIAELGIALQRVDDCVAAHQRELKDKNISVVLDSACLVPNLEVPVRDANSVKLHSSIMRPSGLHTEREWRNNVTGLLSCAPPIRAQARQVVMRARAVVRWVVENGFLDRPTAVVDVLQANLAETERQQMQLEFNARMVQGQLLTLERNRAQLLATLERVHQKVIETQRRLDMKLVRPVVEDARRDIDEDLERATTNLLQSELTIKNQLFEVETRRQRLILLYQDIETELLAKKRSAAMDRTCLGTQIGDPDARGNNNTTGAYSAPSTPRRVGGHLVLRPPGAGANANVSEAAASYTGVGLLSPHFGSQGVLRPQQQYQLPPQPQQPRSKQPKSVKLPPIQR